MINKITRALRQMRSAQSINMALARGAASSALREVDATRPETWEFCGFSQNGEDGIIDVLTKNIREPNRYFVEIGAANGLENNTSWLAIARRFNGMWIEGDPASSEWCEYVFRRLNYGLDIVNSFVTRDSAVTLRESALYANPDVFSLDIDGNDYYVGEAILDAGFRPKIFVVEYNSAFGPVRKISIPYDNDFRVGAGDANNLYYGCSIAAWKGLLDRRGYKFVTVESNGVNAFFLDPVAFDAGFLEAIRPKEFAENYSQVRQYRGNWAKQFAFIADRKYTECD